MPPRSELDPADPDCPDCGESETYVHKLTDRFLCSRCDFSAPIEEVE